MIIETRDRQTPLMQCLSEATNNNVDKILDDIMDMLLASNGVTALATYSQLKHLAENSHYIDSLRE
jgi:hypothetical protein